MTEKQQTMPFELNDKIHRQAYRMRVVRETVAAPGDELTRPEAVVRYCQDLTRCDREHMVRLDLDTRAQLIGIETVYIGTLDLVVISPREILRGAVLSGARHLILVHNHPSGDPSPSKEDLSAAKRFKRLGRLIDVPMVDFLILGSDGRFWSMANDATGRIALRPKQQMPLDLFRDS